MTSNEIARTFAARIRRWNAEGVGTVKVTAKQYRWLREVWSRETGHSGGRNDPPHAHGWRLAPWPNGAGILWVWKERI